MSTKHNRGRPEAAHEPGQRKHSGVFQLANSRIIVENGPAGRIARIERQGCIDYAGPFDEPDATMAALEEVADG